ncbi:unnamed protein product (macronuclear) [Paramecium tetraurelia]|uniref:Transmembrane protein n=1 Tax=Paramecium tetraurelia TaxID=5888 RepID=A0BKZ8_PARTE|nr:uncharacterized protein GSPATT00029846001 [Paramecium tetraurelia]CAK59215.1 unnamed protein product [Paramecium tetraurelia]|eukprot:XP_001426613.1 hypothetical protein (macronuclear) [Paramecium tetraurelia strain d4-2]
MNNNFSNNVNQPTQQQYLNIQSFETQGQQIQKNNYFEQQDKLNDLSIRTNFLKKVFAILLIEFFITYVMFMLVVFTYLFDLFYLIAYICVSDYEDGQKVETCGYYYGPTWVFYFFLSSSMTLQFTHYFGQQSGRQIMHPYLFFFLYQLIYGFTFAIIWAIMGIHINFMGIHIYFMFICMTWGTIGLIIFGLMCYVILKEKDLSFQIGAVIVFFITLLAFIFFVILDSSFALQYLLCAFISIIYGLYLILELRLMIEQDVKIIIFLQEFKIVN